MVSSAVSPIRISLLLLSSLEILNPFALGILLRPTGPFSIDSFLRFLLHFHFHLGTESLCCLFHWPRPTGVTSAERKRRKRLNQSVFFFLHVVKVCVCMLRSLSFSALKTALKNLLLVNIEFFCSRERLKISSFAC